MLYFAAEELQSPGAGHWALLAICSHRPQGV